MASPHTHFFECRLSSDLGMKRPALGCWRQLRWHVGLQLAERRYPSGHQRWKAKLKLRSLKSWWNDFVKRQSPVPFVRYCGNNPETLTNNLETCSNPACPKVWRSQTLFSASLDRPPRGSFLSKDCIEDISDSKGHCINLTVAIERIILIMEQDFTRDG